MAAASEVTRLLDDIDARQQQVIEELDKLLLRIEAVIAEWTEPKKAAAEGTTAAPADRPMIAGEITPATTSEPVAAEPAASEPAAAVETAAAEPAETTEEVAVAEPEAAAESPVAETKAA
jgi:hypothetical protein